MFKMATQLLLKRPNIKRLLILALLIAIINHANARSPVWKVTSQASEQNQSKLTSLYLGGTIHVLSQQDYPLPSAFDIAYAKSDVLVFETDVNQLNQPATQQKLQSAMMFEDEKTLKQSLQKTTYSKLQKYLAERNLPAESFAKFTPEGLSLMLTIIELQRLGLSDGEGVDSYYAIRGKQEGKLQTELESAEQQISYIESMNDEDGDQLILSTMRDSEQLGKIWKEMLTAWRAGDKLALEELGIAPMREEFPQMYQFLLVQRNHNWLPKIREMLTTAEVEFLLVGSLHLVGPEGLIDQLRRAGYTVEQQD